MNKEKYEELLLRFALELRETGVTEDMTQLIKAQCERAPNIPSTSATEITDKFTYRHGKYSIEAKRTVELVVKKCK
tara:strand:+ start:558 stop:785 length:228 start_codon:yes stop_codon:yes gene_type:complete